MGLRGRDDEETGTEGRIEGDSGGKGSEGGMGEEGSERVNRDSDACKQNPDQFGHEMHLQHGCIEAAREELRAEGDPTRGPGPAEAAPGTVRRIGRHGRIPTLDGKPTRDPRVPGPASNGS